MHGTDYLLHRLLFRRPAVSEAIRDVNEYVKGHITFVGIIIIRILMTKNLKK